MRRRATSPCARLGWLAILGGGITSACSGSPPAPPAADGERAFSHLEAQVAFGPRVPGSAASAACREYFLAYLSGRAHRVGLQQWRMPDPYGADTLHLVNLLAHFHPDRAQRVLLAAHYDSRPRADRDTGAARELPVPGANDGGSGAAILLEIAAALAGWDPGVGVDLVFFDGEDYGKEGDLEHYLLGSQHFVETMGGYRPRAMLLLDMVGDTKLRIPMEGNSLRAAPALTQLVFAVAESLGATGFVHSPGPPVIDDHVPFLRAGIEAVDLIDMDYPEWHTTRDLPPACSSGSLQTVTDVVLHVLQRLGRLHGG
ncbi:MAG TPA: M28 family peptidase [Candidatus Krumholzibacteria bacterium]|nr:M28 family peptidase [Candidatus Krumholzibacteria bacterium]